MKVLYRRLIISLLVIACFIVPFATVSNAHSIADLYTDEGTGWQKWGNRHMGSKYTTFSYGSGLTDYYDEIQAGIAMWGSYINFTQVSSNAMGTIQLSTDPFIVYPATTSSTYDSQGHITSWTITIYRSNFNTEINRDNAAVVVAHEIGHVYGLNHVTRTIDIMYNDYSGNQRVSSFDKLGMNVMTHTHVHNSGTTYAIQSHSTTQHKKRCETCYAYHIVDCSYSSHYHSGNYHYLQLSCGCGNSGLKQISCSPLNCPYSGGQIM